MNLNTHIDILEALQAIDPSSLNNPLTEDQSQLSQEIGDLFDAFVNEDPSEDVVLEHLPTAEEIQLLKQRWHDQKSKWTMLSMDIQALPYKEAVRVINTMHKIGGISDAASFAMKCVAIGKAFDSAIGRIAHKSISFATKVFGPQLVSFLFLATKVMRNSLWYFCFFALFLNYPFLLALGGYFVGSMVYSVIDKIFNMFEAIAKGIVADHDNSVIENYAHIHGPKYVPQSFTERISLLVSKAITAVSSRFSEESLAVTRGLARIGFIISAAILPFFPGIALPLLSIMGASFVVDSVAKALSIPHVAKATMAVNETDELCLAQINNSIAPNQQHLEAINNSMALDSKIEFVNLCDKTINSLNAALDSKKYFGTYQTLHLFQGKLGNIPSVAPENGVKLQDNPSLLAINSCLTGEGMLRKPQSTSIKDMPDLSENQQRVVGNIIANIGAMRNYVQEQNAMEQQVSAPVLANAQQPVTSRVTHQYDLLAGRKRVLEKSSLVIESSPGSRLRLTNG